MTFYVALIQSRARQLQLIVEHCCSEAQAVRTAQRANPGWRAVLVYELEEWHP